MFVSFKIHFYSLGFYISLWMIADRLKHEPFSRTRVEQLLPGLFWNVNIFQPAALYLKAFISRHPAWLKNTTPASVIESGSVQKRCWNQHPTERPTFFSMMDPPKGWARLDRPFPGFNSNFYTLLIYLE